MISLPWDDPNSDPIADIRAAKQMARDQHYKIQVIPEGNEVAFTPANEVVFTPIQVESELRYQEYIQEGLDADSVAIVSGGLDSTTLVYEMISQGYVPHLLSFDYGQRHKKELQFAAITAKNLGLRHDIVDLTGITYLISNSALTSQTGLTVRGKNFDGEKFINNIEVPNGHYAEETMKATVVPNRNMIMLSIAAGVAVNNSYRCIAIGVHSGDHFIYPDCRPSFINAMRDAINTGNKGFHSFDLGMPPVGPYPNPIIAPFLHMSKANIAYRALELDVPLHLTWSCYKGGERHCGRCGTCVERLEAIDEAVERINKLDLGATNTRKVSIAGGRGRAGEPWDKTEYDDTEFWKTAVKNAN